MRESGVLMHITSLPGKYGVGTLGKHAFRFVDFLKRAGQSYWQILPLNPTGYGDSPYQSCSAFAGNPYLIDLDLLAEEGLLLPAEMESVRWCSREDRVDYGLLYEHRMGLLEKAYARYPGGTEFEDFCAANSGWLSEFALFQALKDRHGGTPWYEWEKPLKFRDADAVWQARQECREQIRFYSFVQYLFDRQWQALRDYAHENGVKFIGDVPIYVPLDSVEAWVNGELFQLDGDLIPIAVAGCPPDAFTEDGQLWGNPLYRWEEMARDGYGWWIRRLKAAGEKYDVVRLDHFRGFAAYWSVPYGDETARNGRWVKGPGMEFIAAVKKALPDLRLIAEDLGFLTRDVLALRDASGFPGMKVLQFAFDSTEPSDYLPHAYTRNSVCYTGTHDNMTMRQWLDTASPEAAEYASAYMCLSPEEGLVWGVIRTACASVSDLCVVPMQDYLDVDGSGRMNFPGTMSDSNWTWRIKDGIIINTLADRMRKLTQLYGRLGSQTVNTAACPLE